MRPAGPAKSTKSTSGGEKGKKMAAHDRKRQDRPFQVISSATCEGEWEMGANEDNMLGFVTMPPVNSQPGSQNSSTVPSCQPSRQPSRQPSVEFNPLPKKGPQQLPCSGSWSASHTGTPAGSRAHSPNPAPSQPQEPRKRAGQRAGTTAKDYSDFVKSNWSSLVLLTAKHAMFASDQPISNFCRDDILLNTIQEVIMKTCPETNFSIQELESRLTQATPVPGDVSSLSSLHDERILAVGVGKTVWFWQVAGKQILDYTVVVA
ncbi:hypothetical protein E1B28_006797 [Marasmius oreades]|uniref:Uncharacterized protein n=1 Tax=Marasmius oreades TaxID=181124 RepID=A0A9P7UWW9_9AGAR|nr:uncharacterized protein E1B28_006797 [Marasmius oreades]KAG7096123.1 hypothetical protein E1B28_006797 [Marasmius oreades]